MKKHIACIIGTRPEFLKLAPIVLALQKMPKIKISVILTGQHREMIDQLMDLFHLPIIADYNIMLDGQSISHISSEVLNKLESTLRDISPDFVVVQGDTTTTLYSAIAAFYQKIPIGYIESGLRTNNIYSPFPEEMNRRLVTQIATLHFTPTKETQKNLLSVGIKQDSIYITGNTIIDTLAMTLSQKPEPIFTGKNKTVLITCHRRENFGSPLQNIIDAIAVLASRHADIDFIFPVHPNPVIQKATSTLNAHKNIHLIAPLAYPQFVAQLKAAYLVMTDSGGIQEEAPFLGKPLVILRNDTERPEAVTTGNSILAGTETNKIIDSVEEILNNNDCYQRMSKTTNIFGDGNAAKRITSIISDWLFS